MAQPHGPSDPLGSVGEYLTGRSWPYVPGWEQDQAVDP